MAANDIDVTLYSLLFNGSAETGAVVLLEGVKGRSPTVVATWPEVQWKQIAASIEDQVESGFDMTLGSILAQGWCDLSSVREAVDPSRTPADMTKSVTLASHELEWATRPKLVISIDGMKSLEVEFELLLTLDIDAAIMSVRDARIHGIALGKCHGEAKISCEGQPVYRCPLKDIRFPGQLRFPDGIPIPHARPRSPERRSI